MRGAQRAATLTQRLLAFSRQQPLDPKPLDVNKFIAAEVEFLQRSLGETIEVQAVGSAGLWPVEVDADQLGAALLNLAVNARDGMPNGGKLTIETSNAFLDQDYCRANPEIIPGQYVMIAVSDNGTGMTKDVVDRAFEPFFSTKAVGQGSGSCRSSNRLPLRSAFWADSPVRLPPGCAKLATRPEPTGSPI